MFLRCLYVSSPLARVWGTGLLLLPLEHLAVVFSSQFSTYSRTVSAAPERVRVITATQDSSRAVLEPGPVR